VDASLQQQLTLAAVGMSGAALFFSLLAAFPGLKSVLAAVRDGVLWFSLFVVIGAGAFLVWQSAQRPATQLAADSAPQAAR
jgi:hypothetical protein